VAQCLDRYASLVNVAGSPGTPKAWTRRLLRCGVAAGPAFMAVFLLEGAVRDGYRPLRHPVSSLALGPRGWIQAGNFALTGALFLAAAAGLARAHSVSACRKRSISSPQSLCSPVAIRWERRVRRPAPP
jgi:hypothetical protein